MKILLDQNISFKLIKKLQDIFPLINQVKGLGFEGATDKKIWEYAKKNNYVIVTFDSDFYDIIRLWNYVFLL